MKVNLSYTEKDIVRLIQKDVEDKIGRRIGVDNIKVLVQSRQKYREHIWEHGKLKCELEADV